MENKTIKRIKSSGEEEIYKYDNKNLVYTLINDDEVFYAYNKKGKITSIINNDNVMELHYSRDNKLKKTCVTNPNGYVVTEFDKYDMIVHVMDTGLEYEEKWVRINDEYLPTYIQNKDYSCIRKYDNNGREIYSKDNNELEIITTHSGKSKTIRTKTIDNVQETYSYDDNNNLIYRSYISDRNSYSYRYDINGNCISETRIDKL